MDRHCLSGIVLLLAALVGCSKSPPDATATAPTPAPAPSDWVGASNTATPAAPAPAEPNLPESAPQDPAFRIHQSPQPPSATPEADLAAQPTAAAPTSRAGAAANPLRLDVAPPSNNPLRSRFSAQPQAALPPAPAPTDRAALPPASPPAGGSVMPAAPEPLAPAADVPPAATVAASGEPFDVVQVFYGTNRQCTEPGPADWKSWLTRFLPSAASLAVTLCLAMAAIMRRSFLLCLLAVAGLACTGGLGYQASAGTLAAVRRIASTGPRYTTARAAGGHVDLGICEISIPRTHDPGEVESPSITRLEILPDATRHVVLQKTERLETDPFYDLLRHRVAASERKELFVFIHGFNVSFEDAARRTAQIHYDLKFAGAPVFFSWPANDKFIFTYPADETNVAWSVPHFKKFLLDIVQNSGAQSINLIAHSMGNRALAAALREIDLELNGQARLFNQVILAAPDIDAQEFRDTIAPAMQRTARQMTLYASSRDDALLASQLVHRGPRAGDAGSGLVVVNGIDTIDVTAIDTSPWGHSYYGSSDPVLNDLRELFTRAVPPRDRTWLSPAQRDGLTYWIFQAARTASANPDTAR